MMSGKPKITKEMIQAGMEAIFEYAKKRNELDEGEMENLPLDKRIILRGFAIVCLESALNIKATQ